ncbi:alpha/beta hydrolase [Caldilinea sp.]|uniref:alpha/beta fold hydrolase n=1 Tax=Caldilinea sp. TaxID=2293560 RepID=UPI002BCCDD27|nr:alpha/beta hydrolase [Caldilinea sp.]HRA65332.1 alpha/beta hydrolase [Caldilinea sp.]
MPEPSMRTFATETGVIAYELLEANTPLASPTVTPTIVLLHNFMSTGRAAWGALLDALTEHFRVLLPDLPGHGQSVGHPIGFHHRHIAQQLAALLAHEDVLDAHLAGCSSGGMIAQLLVADGWMQPASLALVSTTYSTNPATTGQLARLEPARFQAGRRWMAATARLHDPFHYEGYYEDVVLAGFRRLRPETAIDLHLSDLARFALPVCLIHGADDEFFPVAIPQAMAAALPDATLHIIPGQTHGLIFRQPWRVAELMVQFLDAHSLISSPIIARPGEAENENEENRKAGAVHFDG